MRVTQQPAMRIAGFPRRYIQGPGILKELPALLETMPKPVGVVAERGVFELLDVAVRESIRALTDGGVHLDFTGECTRAEIARLAGEAQSAGVRSVLALGGGKSLDTGKGIARSVGAGIAVAPTIASNDAPTSRLIVIYHEDHSVDGVEYLPWNPDVVLVDTEVIAAAPARFLRAGIGDAIAKRFELEQVIRAGGSNFFDTQPPAVAGVFARASYETIIDSAEDALAACAQGRTDDALEQVVEACVLASGAGFENGGLSIAHAMCRGLAACAATRGALHGEMVAFALLIQLRLTEAGAESLDELQTLYRRLGLPDRPQMLGADRELTRLEMETIAEGTLGAPYIANFERTLTTADIVNAIEAQRTTASARPQP